MINISYNELYLMHYVEEFTNAVSLAVAGAQMTDLLTTREVQNLLHVDRTTIYRMVEGGQLPAVRVGKQWRFARTDLDRWLRRQSAALAQPASAPQVASPTSPAVARTSEELRDMLPLGCVQVIQDAFADILGVMIVITDMDGRPLTKPSNPCGLYNAVIHDAEGMASCIGHWQQMAGGVTLEPKFSPSDLGLLCARGLIRAGNELKGMVFFGGIAPDVWPPSQAEVAVMAEHFGLTAAEIEPDLQAVHRQDKPGRDRVLQFVQRIADIVSHLVEARKTGQ